MVHSDRTLRRKITGKANATARAHMQTALWTRKTEAGCRDSISKAIETAKDEATRAYIRKNWEVYIEMWAYFARRKACSVTAGKISIFILYDLTGLTCISVLQLQITSTNAVEGWHSQLKNNLGALKNEIPKYSLRGCCQHVASVASEYDKSARLKQCEFDSKDVLEAVQFHPTLQKFPYLAQYLISEEIHLLYKADMELANNDEMIKMVDDVISCTCRFWEAYQLPCRHILKQHKEFNTITDKQWDDWLWIWKDSEGFEVYERADRTYATVGIYEAIGGPEPQKLEFREVVDQLQNAFYQKQQELEGQQYPREIRHI